MRDGRKSGFALWVMASIFALFLSSIGVYVICTGIEIIGTPFWGYADNAPGVYYVMGGLWAFVGILLLIPACLLVKTAVVRR